VNIQLLRNVEGKPRGRQKLADIIDLKGERAAENVNVNFDGAR